MNGKVKPVDRFLSTVSVISLTASWLVIEGHRFWIEPFMTLVLVGAIALFTRTPLAERLLRFHERDANGSAWSLVFSREPEIWPGPNVFLEEGRAALYSGARFAELRVTLSGTSILA